MNKNSKALVKTLHILFACLWLGASTSVVLLQCLMGWSKNRFELATLNQEFTILDFVLIIPGAVGSFLTGFLICKSTSWGFSRYRWVVVKWICTLSGILVGSFLLGPWQLQMVNLTNQAVDFLADGSPYHQIRFLFTLTGLLQVVLLVFIVTISVRKPWGKRMTSQKETNRVEQRNEGLV